MPNNYILIPLGKQLAHVIDYEKSSITLNAANMTQQRAIRSLTRLVKAPVELIVSGVSLCMFVRVYPNTVNYHGVAGKGVVATYKVDMLTAFTANAQTSDVLTASLNSVVPWQRDQVKVYQLNALGRYNE